MATRFIKDTIWTSPNLNQLSDLAERHFYRLLPLPDDHGCCEVTPAVLKGRCYPLKAKISVDNIQKWTQDLIEADIIRVWEDKGRLFAWFPTWSEHQRVRSLHQRKTPEPPSSVTNCRQPPSTVADRGPLPLPSPSSSSSPLPPSPPTGGASGFEEFWNTYPNKTARGAAERVWKKTAPNAELRTEIMAGLSRAIKSPQWAKDGGQFIPHPATWLNQKRWLDEYPRSIVDPKTGIRVTNPVYRGDPPPTTPSPPPVHDPPRAGPGKMESFGSILGQMKNKETR